MPAGSGQLPTTMCVPTQPTVASHGVLSQVAFPATYSLLKVFGYVLKLALRELHLILVLREITVSENFHRKE